MHALHAAVDGSKALMFTPNNSDVVVIAISVMKSLSKLVLEKNCVWPRRKFLMDFSARNGKHNRSRESQWTPIPSRIHWMRHCVCFPWQSVVGSTL